MLYFRIIIGLIALTLVRPVSCELDQAALAGLDRILSKPLRLDKLTFGSDSLVDPQEFDYLVDLPVQTKISAVQVKNACFYLSQTQRFRGLDLVFRPTSNASCSLHFQLKSQTCLAKIEISGVVSGRDWYRRLYGLQYGAKFTIAQHRHALFRLRHELKSAGYLDVKILDRVVIDSKTKLATVKLKILLGKQYQVQHVQLVFDSFKQQLAIDLVDPGLLSKLKKSLLKQRYTQSLLNHKINQFKRELELLGYPFATVQLELLKSPQIAKLKLRLMVQLGQKFQYRFTGNSQYSAAQLMDYLRRQGRQHWHLPVEFAINDLRNFYRQRGFSQVQISGQQLAEGCEILIVEGPRLSIQKINLMGVNRFRASWLKLRFFKKLMFQKYYDQQVLDRSLASLKYWYNRAGYWDFRLERSRLVPIQKEGDFGYTLELVVHEGAVSTHPDSSQINSPSQLFGKTVKRGNGQFKFTNLYRVLPYQDGDSWSASDLQSATCQLKNLDSFDQVRLLPGRELDFFGHRPVIMHLNQSYDFEMRTRLGFQKVSKNLIFKSGATYKVGSSLVYKNIHQTGNQVRLDFDFTRFYRSTAAVYQRPIYWKWPLTLALKVYDNKYEQPLAVGSKQRLYNAYQQGGMASLSYRDGALDATLNLGFEGVKIDDLSQDYAQAIDFTSNLVDRRVPFFLFEPTCVIDRLDDSLNPRRGTFSLFSLKSMTALDQTKSYFGKVLLEQAFFYPIFEQSTVAARIRMGHIFTNNFSSVMPIERFYLGGANSLRSFEVDSAPPVGLIRTKDGEELLVPQGGKSMINLNFELRIPLYHSLGVVFFQDLGTLFKYQMRAGGELLTATGIGLRYQTPVGPLRFDIGWRPRRFAGDRNFAWFLTIGQAF